MKTLLTFILALFYVTAGAQTISYRNLNPNQFSSNNFMASLKSGVRLTNPVVIGTLTGGGGIATNGGTGINNTFTNAIIAIPDETQPIFTNYATASGLRYSSTVGGFDFSADVYATQFHGDGSGLTGIGTNSMSTAAHEFYSTGGGGGITALDATNISSFIVGRRGADNVHVNVLDYGATPYIHTDNTVPVSLAIADQYAFITNAIFDASLGGPSNVVLFPEGIYRHSQEIFVPRNVTLQGVGIMFGNGVTSGYNLVTNNYSMLWRYPLGNGVSFYDVSPGNGSGIRDISIHGHTNPVSASALVSSPSSTFGGIGLRVYDEDSFWCQRFTGDNFAVAGFKVGLWAEVNNARFDNAMLQGNDVSYLSTYTNYFPELRDAGLDSFNTNILILSSNRNGTRRTEFARGEQNTLVLPSGGGRAGSLCYFLAGTRSLAIEGASDFQFSQYAWLIDSLMTVDGMAAEMDTMSGTNFVRAFGSQAVFNLSGAYINGNPALPSWALVNNLAQSFSGTLDGMILGSIPTHLDSGEALLLLSPKQSHAFLRNINGSGVMAMTDDPTYWVRLDNSTRYHEFYFQGRNPVYGGADPFATNFVGQVGRMATYKAPTSYLEPEYEGGVLRVGTNAYFTRRINSDFQTAQEFAAMGNKHGTNITAGDFRATGQILGYTYLGNGGGLTNIGTNSMSAAAHALYIEGGGSSSALSNVTDSGYAALVRSNLVVTGGGTGLPGLTVGGTVLVVTNGNVGIGTVTPTTKVQVAKDATAYGTTGAYGQLELTGATTPAYRLSLGFNVNTEKAFIQSIYNGAYFTDLLLNPSGGNVGIGTTTPVGKLDVNGTNRVTELHVTNGITLGGVRRTDWPAGGGGDSVWHTPITNNAATTNGYEMTSPVNTNGNIGALQWTSPADGWPNNLRWIVGASTMDLLIEPAGGRLISGPFVMQVDSLDVQAPLTVGGTITMNGASQIINLADPDDPQDAATKVYVDNNIRTNTAPFSVDTTAFVIGVRYTNSLRRSFVTASFQLGAAAAGTAAVSLRCEQAGVTNRVNISAGPLASLSTVEQLSLMVGPGAFYYFVDDTSGTGASVSIVAGTSSRTDM